MNPMIKRTLHHFVGCACLVGVAATASAQVGNPQPATLLSTLDSHLGIFIGTSFPGEMNVTTSLVTVVRSDTDTTSYANLVTNNAWVINQTATPDFDITGSTFVQLSGDGQRRFQSQCVMPHMVEGAIIAKVDWDWGPEACTTYAVVPPYAVAGMPETMLETVSEIYAVPDMSRGSCWTESAGDHCDFFRRTFVNGFGSDVGCYMAYLDCDHGSICSGHAEGTDSRVGCSGKAKKKVECVTVNGRSFCKMTAAFVGHCGFPSVKFNADEFGFEVSGFGWDYFNTSTDLSCPCDCAPDVDVVPPDAIDHETIDIDEIDHDVIDNPLPDFDHDETGLRADIDRDGDVDMGDLSDLLQNWGNLGGASDLDGSGRVDYKDLVLLLDEFGAVR